MQKRDSAVVTSRRCACLPGHLVIHRTVTIVSAMRRDGAYYRTASLNLTLKGHEQDQCQQDHQDQ